MSHEDSIKVLKRYARKMIRFNEQGYDLNRCDDPKHLMLVGFIIEGGFGIGDDFFDAMRSLRKSPSRAKSQAKK